jgi:small subunit ribosomal protein S21
LKIEVRNNNVEKALRVMKKKLKKEGIFDEMKERRYYQKPSEKRREAKKRGYVNIKKAERLRRNFL